jgi:uncharacterized protein YbjT (DUF2867 family)
MTTNPIKILVTGATGYIGGRTVSRLISEGYQVRVFVRDPSRLQGRPWVSQVEIVAGDILKPDSLPAAMQGIDVAYYLIHSMSHGEDFNERDIAAARNFSLAAEKAGVQRIIYLGGLGDPQSDLSEHLRSRQQTGDTLRQGNVPVTEFRAAIIVGSGSLSFEMIRYLIERVPVMVTPRWVSTRVQPIGIRNVLDYLVGALKQPEIFGKIIEIGGADILTYGEMMLGYSRVRGLKRFLLPVPILSPRLSSYWVHLVTPLPASIARPLIDGLRNEVIVRNNLAQELFPDIHPMSYEEAVKLALMRLRAGEVETSWSDALITSQGDVPPVILTNQQGMILEIRNTLVDAPASAIYQTFSRLGGDQGWPYLNWTWQLRGWVDRFVGGVGMRRGRRDPIEVRVGDALDFWRVEAVDPDHLLRLRAEMKVPGQAWLQFEVHPQPNEKVMLTQTAFFAPKGLWGLIYWYVLYPLHSIIFSGLIRKIAEGAQNGQLQPDKLPAITP